jgi:hypothetical protein
MKKLLPLLIVVGIVFFIGCIGGAEQCQTVECFNNALANCNPAYASWDSLYGTITFEITGTNGSNCVIKNTVDLMGTTHVKEFEILKGTKLNTFSASAIYGAENASVASESNVNTGEENPSANPTPNNCSNPPITNISFAQEVTPKEYPTSDVVEYINGTYITKQLSKHDSEIRLRVNYALKAGDSIEYDVNHVSGEGNHMSRIVINNLYLDEQLSGDGAIGYWNGVHGYGNDFGVYRVKVTYANTEATIEVTQPSGSNKQDTVGITGTDSFAIESHSGDNGLFEFDYYNFKIITHQCV